MKTQPSKPRAHAAALLWAAILGALSALACVAARLTFRLLQWLFTGQSGMLPHAAATLPPLRRVLVPVVGALCAWTILRARQRSSPTPYVDYGKAVRASDGVIPFPSTLWRTAASAFSIATGAAIGREGSMIQFASATTSLAGSWAGRYLTKRALTRPRTAVLLRDFPLPTQVACGVAAAVSAAYQAPVAGVFFASEIVLARATLPEYSLLLTASVAGWLLSRPLLGPSPIFAAPAALPPLQAGWLWLLPLALFLSLLSPAYQWLIRCARGARSLPLALVWGGAAVGLLSLVRTEVWGNGDQALRDLLHTDALPAASALGTLLVLRLLATTLCVGVGTIGGVFTPTLFVGAALGLLAAHLVHAPSPLLFAFTGLGALLAAVTRAPLMATFMAVELTGRWELLPIALLSNLAASQLASRLTPHSLYAIATTEPGDHHRTPIQTPAQSMPLPEKPHSRRRR